jgi:hypothetical protein
MRRYEDNITTDLGEIRLGINFIGTGVQYQAFVNPLVMNFRFHKSRVLDEVKSYQWLFRYNLQNAVTQPVS